ncbi:MAG: aldehyde reductase [Pseudomonadales bacterium]|nr:aldehyde reductase [Pseudomonadales bacterium]
MTEVENNLPVLVTGANGYVASWIVKKLLEKGYTVHATVRNPNDEKKVKHLLQAAQKEPGTLKLFKADLLEEGSFEDAMKGCGIVMHTASPFKSRNIKKPMAELIDPAKKGTKNVLDTVNKAASVERVVLTSSVAAVFGDIKEFKKSGKSAFNETDWNTTSSAKRQPYFYSKTVAEKLAWEMHDQQSRWTMTTINPGMVFGPALSTSSRSESIQVLRDFGTGLMLFGAPKLTFAAVDVRDVAEAHILAASNDKASGRHILASDSINYMDISKTLKKHFGGRFPFPRFAIPNWMVYLVAPFVGLERQFVKDNMGYPLKLDASYAKKDLGIQFTPLKQTLVDHFQQQLDDGLVKRW